MKVSIYNNYKNKLFLISVTSFFLSSLVYQPVEAQIITTLPEFCKGDVEEDFKEQCSKIKQKIIDATDEALDAEIKKAQNAEAKSNIIIPAGITFQEGAKPLSGDITVSESEEEAIETMESKILAYQAIDKITGDICRSIDSKIENNSHIVIHDNETINAIPSYLILNSRKELYKKAYNDLFKEAELELKSDETEATSSKPNTNKGVIDGGLLALPGAVARTIIEFSSLFKTEQKINNSTFTIDTESIVSSLDSKCKKSKIYYPSVYLLNIQNQKSNVETFWGELDFLLNSLQTATSYILEFENKGIENITADQTTILQKLKAQNDAVTAFFNELKAVNEENTNALYLMAKAKTVHENLLKDKNAYMLKLESVESGGSVSTRRAKKSGGDSLK